MWSASDWWAWCSLDVVDGILKHLALGTRGANEVRKFGEEGVDRSNAIDDMTLGSANWRLEQGHMT
jgi:hypothetical protein